MPWPLLSLLGGGASAAGAAGATGAAAGAAGTGALAGGLTSTAALGGLAKIGAATNGASSIASMGPALQQAPQLAGFSSNVVNTAGGMDLSKIASRFGVPGAPGSVGGTSLGGGSYNSGLVGSGFDFSKLKKLGGALGNGGSAMQGGIQPPSPQGGQNMPFSPFPFSMANYQFRRPIGF